MRLIGWPGKRKTEIYPSFNRRMWAATVDSFIAIIFFLTLFDYLFTQIYGSASQMIDMRELQYTLSQQPTTAEVLRVFWQTFHESGLYDRWVKITSWQITLMCLASAYCWRKWGATPGKMLFRIKVVDEKTGGALSDKQVVLRAFGYLVSAFPLCLGFFWISFDKRRQSWHDKLAGTLVVFAPKKATPDSEAVRPSDSPAPSEEA